MNLDELERLYKAATPGEWKGEPKRLVFQGRQGPMMSYLVGHKASTEGMVVTLGSERFADHEFVAALHNAFPALLALARDGERYRTTRLLASRGKLPPEWWEGFTERELDAAIDAARKGEK